MSFIDGSPGTPLDEGTTICMSGGAKGADLLWGMTAGKLGHHVIHFSFAGHKTMAPESEVVRLTEEQLREADPYLLRANKTLKRRLAFHQPWKINLFRRDYYQVKWSDTLYAVSTFDERGNVAGGTAWAVRMFLDLERTKAYLFDQVAGRWLKWEASGWREIDAPPPPVGIWAGVGTRELAPAGKQAIHRLMNYQPASVAA